MRIAERLKGSSRAEIRGDMTIFVFEGVAHRGLRPIPRRPHSLVAEARAVVLTQVRKWAVNELSTGINELLRVCLEMVVFVSGKGMLPCTGAADRQLSAGQKIVLMGNLVAVWRQY